ncbi:MAG: hypothetical protein ACR2KT_09865 [Methylocella sp.]
MADVDVTRPESVSSALRAIELRKKDFVVEVIRPKNYQELLRLWLDRQDPAVRSQAIEALERAAPDELRAAIRSFALGVRLATDSNESTVAVWNDRLASDLADVDVMRPESVSRALRAIELLKKDFVVLVIRPKNYRELLRLWLYTMGAIMVASLLIGDQSILSECQNLSTLSTRSDPPSAGESLFDVVAHFCGVTHGHFFGYIAFRYAAYGVLMGTALFGSLSSAQARFADPAAVGGLLTRPILRVVLSLAIAYILALLVASGKLSFDILGFNINHDLDSGDHQGFRDPTSLFAIGMSAAMAADVYLNRIAEALRKSAKSFLGTSPQADKPDF